MIAIGTTILFKIILFIQIQNHVNGQAFHCPYDGEHYLPHPYECTKFIMCLNGYAIIKQCAPGTNYDSIQKLCGPVECNYCYAYPINAITQIPSSRDCSEYFICMGHKQITHKCPTGMYYDAYRMRCDYKMYVNCVLGESQPPTPPPPPPPTMQPITEAPTTTTTTTTVTPIPPPPMISIPPLFENIPEAEPDVDDEMSCPINGGNAYLPHPSVCSWYYSCEMGVKHIKSCSPGLIFDGRIKECVIQQYSDQCFANYMPICDQNKLFQAHPHSCQHYFICVNNLSVLQKCADGLMFDSNVEQCNILNDAVCYNKVF